MKIQRQHRRPGLMLMLALTGLVSGVTFMPGSAGIASAQVVAPSWSYTGNLNTARDAHTATLLQNGRVLIAGGADLFSDFDFLPAIDGAELYDPATGAWSRTGSLNTARQQYTATLLSDGKVLVAGGIYCELFNGCYLFNSTEIYDPSTGTWSPSGNLITGRSHHTATLLPNGKVLVAGDGTSHRRAELYDPTTGLWSYTGSLSTSRFDHTATLLPNGKVLVAGGAYCTVDPDSGNRTACFYLNSAELFDPATGTWSSTGSLNGGRAFHTAALLPNGKVLVAGGWSFFTPLDSAELYDPATETWTSTSNLNLARGNHTATLLPNGKVLVAGGRTGEPLNGVESYDPASGTWSTTVSLNSQRAAHTATLLPNERVLVTGGSFDNTAELWDAGTNPNPIDDAQSFVRQHYRDFLNREPDAGGLAYWTNEITKCGSDARCIHNRRIGVSGAFFVEPEFQETGYFVDRLSQASFGHHPTFAQFNADRAQVIVGPNLEASKQALAASWVERTAFKDAYLVTMSPEEFVNKLFDTANLRPYTSERLQLAADMRNGKSRAQVLREVIEIAEFKTRQYNPAFVLMQYFGYLRRNVDQGGYDFWLDVLNNREPNNYRGMICSFITSREYQERFGSLVTRSNADCGQ